MGVTASVDFRNSNIGEAGAIEKHNKREYDNGSNRFIVDGRNLDLNRTHEIDKNQALENRYRKEIDEKNQHAKEMFEAKKYGKARFKKEWIESPEAYLKRKEKQGGISSTIIQIGDTDDYKNFLRAEKIPFDFDDEYGFTYPDKDKMKRVVQLYAKTLNALNKEFVKSGAFIPYSMDLHMDEGYPHLHMQYLNNGDTDKGKPSISLDRAVKKFLEYEGLDTPKLGRANMAEIRKFTDNFLIEKFNENLKDLGFKSRDFELVRKGGTDTKASSQERKQAMATSKKVLDEMNDEYYEVQSNYLNAKEISDARDAFVGVFKALGHDDSDAVYFAEGGTYTQPDGSEYGPVDALFDGIDELSTGKLKALIRDSRASKSAHVEETKKKAAERQKGRKKPSEPDLEL